MTVWIKTAHKRLTIKDLQVQTYSDNYPFSVANCQDQFGDPRCWYTFPYVAPSDKAQSKRYYGNGRKCHWSAAVLSHFWHVQ